MRSASSSTSRWSSASWPGRKDHATVDSLLNGLAAAGGVVEDAPNGPHWSPGG